MGRALSHGRLKEGWTCLWAWWVGWGVTGDLLTHVASADWGIPKVQTSETLYLFTPLPQPEARWASILLQRAITRAAVSVRVC